MFNENKPTVLKFEHGGVTQTVELPWDANMEQILQAFYGMCISSTWMPSTVIESMYEFAKDQDIYGWTPVNDIENSPENRD